MSLLYSEIYKSEHISLPLTERSVAYGDGIFTTAKIAQGKIVDLAQHLNRLKTSAKILAIPYDDIGLTEHLIHLAKQYAVAVLKIVITAGEGGRGYSRLNAHAQKILITVYDYPKHYKKWALEGINAGLAKSRLGISPMLAGIKHLNRLEQVFIRQELDSRNEDDLLILNCEGHVIEASAGNVFWQQENTNCWQTPALDKSGVNGLMRQKILMTLPNTSVLAIDIEHLGNIQAMFVCNSVMGIIPVKKFNGIALNIDSVHQLQRILDL